MSMSQEEIESLMNGLDFDDEETKEAPAVEESAPEGNMSADDIDALIAQTESATTSEEPAAVEETSSEELAGQDSVDELLNSLEESSSSEEVSNNDIDDLLKDLDSSDTQEESGSTAEETSEENFDDILATIDGVEDNTPAPEVTPEIEEIPIQAEPIVQTEQEPVDIAMDSLVPDEVVKDWTDNKIQEGIFPLPVEEDTKVVNQLSAVANDSEEKASKIFDVLSNILDYNGEIQSGVQNLTEFNNKQIAMLESLNAKFPSIEAFKANLDHARQMGSNISEINGKIDEGNNEIFQAMELMQFHDINRQKIERVMAVIRKLSTYLNNLFEDETGGSNEIAVAKHIHGDNTADLLGDDDLESLIAEFGK